MYEVSYTWYVVMFYSLFSVLTSDLGILHRITYVYLALLLIIGILDFDAVYCCYFGMTRPKQNLTFF